MDATPTLDARMMAEAVRCASHGFPAPNPHVGCVIARGEEILGRGFHHHAGGPHAEVEALLDSGAAAKGATAYVTLEPCNHRGRTGPCSLALIEAGVSRVVYAVSDPNPRAVGGGERLREAGVAVEQMDFLPAEEVNRIWLTAVRRKRPYVTLKAAVGVDGRLSLPDGRSQWITGSEARTEAMRLRAQLGCVLVGARTAVQDNPRLTARIPDVVNQPTRAIMAKPDFDFSGLAMSNELGETLIVPQDVAEALSILYDRGITSLLVEGGAQTHARFLAAGFVDEIVLFVAPRILGQGPVWVSGDFGGDPLGESPAWKLVESEVFGDDLKLVYRPRS